MTVSEVLSSDGHRPHMMVNARPTFTCASCHSIFGNAESQRAHYQSDWHRYNLRRKVAELPPVTESVFLSRLDLLGRETAAAGAAPTGHIFDCTACRKTFASEKSFENHIKARKHLEAVSAGVGSSLPALGKKSGSHPGEGSKASSNLYLDKDASEEQIREALESRLSLARRLRPEECIFCNHCSEGFESNMEHMTKEHSLYIPDLDFVEDLQGLVAYLADKVGVAFCCLYCPASVWPFQSLEAVRRHMIDKGHLKIRFDEEGMEELANFYNYEQIVSDDGDEDFVDVDEDEEGYGVHDDDTLYISPDETKLLLPSGKCIGHRACRTTNQHRRTEEPARPTRRSEHQALLSRMSDHYLAVGLVQPTEQRRHVAAQRRYHDERKEWDARIGIRNNGLQEHFRYQLRQ